MRDSSLVAMISRDELDASADSDLSRLRALDELLPTLAGALDVRQVFHRISEIAQQVIPHDRLGLPLLTDDKTGLVLHAAAGGKPGPTEVMPLSEHHKAQVTSPREYVLCDDVQNDPEEKQTPPARAGYRALLRVPIRVQDEVLGALSIYSLQPNVYTVRDVLIAKRIADYVALALSHQRLAEEAQRTAEARERATKLERRVQSLTSELESLGSSHRIVGQSAAWKHVLKQATQVASTDTTVLLLGESGTGKEVIARFIHRGSSREGRPFVALNCAALPEQLLESELFGYERGAFTGAQQSKPGQLEQAAGGVLFLDEVGEMSGSAQAKFLRVLQEKEFQRLGGTRVLKANVRIIAATNRNLEAAMERGAFREDLYYRLQVFEIKLPSLRERPDDILLLSRAFLEEIGKTFGRPPAGVSRDARSLLQRYHWPGNVRQLRNTLERAAILCEGGLITGEHLSLPVRGTSTPSSAREESVPARPAERGTTSTRNLKAVERDMIAQALVDARQNRSQAAKILGLTRSQLYVRMKKYGLE